MEKAVIAISGGIDSAVSAFLLKEQGYQVTGIHFNILESDAENQKTIDSISEVLQISIETVDVHERFQKTVMQYFTSEHLKGNTPSPCAICNPLFKWKLLEEYAVSNGANLLATGHYIQKVFENELWYLKKGIDSTKDQSYYLWGLPQHVIKQMINPLGHYTKTETRNLAGTIGLDFLLSKKESMGLCFAMKDDYTQILKNHIPEISSIGTGEIIDKSGNVVGSHKGFIYYTIGQKRDLNLTKETNYCVTEIDAIHNKITVGLPEDLWKYEFEIADCVFVESDMLNQNKEIQVKIRGIGLNPAGNCKILPIANNQYRIVLEQPAWAPAPGQPAVFYNNEILLGGGFIC